MNNFNILLPPNNSFIYKWNKIINLIQQSHLSPLQPPFITDSNLPYKYECRYEAFKAPPFIMEECPICLEIYSAALNRTKCCLQPICTRCFLQLPSVTYKPSTEHEQSVNVDNGSFLANLRHFSTQISETLHGPASSSATPHIVKCPYCANERKFSVIYFTAVSNAAAVQDTAALRTIVQQHAQKRDSSLWKRFKLRNHYKPVKLNSLRIARRQIEQ